MNGEHATKNISPIRTFAQDAAFMKGQRRDDSPKIPEKEIVVPAVEEEVVPVVPDLPKITPVTKALAPRKILEEAPIVHHVARDKQIDLTDEVSQINTQRKSSILSDGPDGFDGDRAGSSGTIIRDTKRKRFRLFPAMIEAVVGWATNQKVNFENRKPPTHAVSTAESRKDIIEAAVQHGVQAP